MSEVTDTRSMFRNTALFNGNIDNWDVSKVADMSGMFLSATIFNRDISAWDVTSVQSMQSLFQDAVLFNQDLSAWNNRLGSLTDMDFIFSGALAFTENISGWVVTSVLSMNGSFANTTIFNRSLASWDVSNVTNMQNMFTNATGFDQSLGSWDISSVAAMNFMFNNSGMTNANYDATLIGWESLDAGETQIPTGVDLGAIGLTYCAGATAHASLMGTYGWTINDAGQQCDFITTWKTDNPGTSGNNQITIPTDGTSTYNYDVVWGDGMSDTGVTGDITHTYAGPGTYTVSISGTFPHIFFNNGGDREKILTVEQWGDIAWNSMFHAFYGCTNLTSTASDAPDLSGATVIGGVFRGASSFNGPVGNWDVSTITDMQNVFSGASSFNQPIGTWQTGNVTAMNNMFRNATAFDQDIGSWSTGGVFNMNAMFSGATSFNQNINGWTVSNVFNFSFMFSGATSFNQDLNSWVLTNANNTAFMFFNASAFNGNIGAWVPAAVTNMNAMFGGASSFNQDINNWDVGAVTNMAGMFQNATTFNQSLNSWNVANVTVMDFMFFNATSFDGNIGSWNVGAVTNMNSMFSGASSFNQDISGWTTGAVNSMAQMFLGASSFDQAISGWNVGAVTSMRQLFHNASSFNQNINGWNVSNVTDLHQAFTGATSFDQSLSGWDVRNVTTMFSMLNSTALSTANYDATLIGWQSLPSLQNGVDLGANGLTYCAGESARAALIATNLWVISGDSKNCPPPPPFIVTNTNDSGISSLRWVIDNANTMAGADVVNFNIPTTDPNYNSTDGTWTIQPVTPLPTITEELDIDAGTQPGSTNRRVIVDGQSTISLFSINIPINVDVIFSDLQIINAFSSSAGAAISIIDVFRVRADNCLFSNNESQTDGGAISDPSSSFLVLDDSDFVNNISGGAGGAIIASGSIDAIGCNFLNNQANSGNGGAIHASPVISYYLERNSFIGNTSSGNGGAITINNSSHSLWNLTFSGNTAAGNGGAIYSDGMFNGIDLRYVTIFQNTAASGGGIYMEEGSISLQNSVVASNTGGEYGQNNGNINSNGHNFVSLDPSAHFTNSGDISDTSTPLDPQLGPLVNNGITYYHPPITGSPLIDAGTNIAFISDDQTELARPQGPTEDIGSIEYCCRSSLLFLVWSLCFSPSVLFFPPFVVRRGLSSPWSSLSFDLVALCWPAFGFFPFVFFVVGGLVFSVLFLWCPPRFPLWSVGWFVFFPCAFLLSILSLPFTSAQMCWVSKFLTVKAHPLTSALSLRAQISWSNSLLKMWVVWI